jgi:hypothetical protein
MSTIHTAKAFVKGVIGPPFPNGNAVVRLARMWTRYETVRTGAPGRTSRSTA